MNDIKIFLNTTLILLGIILFWFLYTPKTYRQYILPTWDKPIALCKDGYFSWEFNDSTCVEHKGISIMMIDK